MIISDYGKYTNLYLKDFGTIELDGWIEPPLNSKYLMPDGKTEYFVKGYSHRKHSDIIFKRGDTQSLGWVVNEVIGMSIVNPKGVAIARQIK